VRNTFISLGVFWLSITLALPLSFLFARLSGGIPYGRSILAALAMGVMLSLGRTCAAVLAGMFVALTAVGPRPERWAWLLAILYATDTPWRSHWLHAATPWDRAWQGVALVLPPLAYLAAAFLTARYRPIR